MFPACALRARRARLPSSPRPPRWWWTTTRPGRGSSREILTDAGLEVNLAGGLEAALARVRARRHRLAVIDLSLGAAGPGNQDGLSVIWAIRREDPGCAAILLTGFATVELAVRALKDYGAYTCLQKDSFRRAKFRELLGQRARCPARLRPGRGGRCAGSPCSRRGARGRPGRDLGGLSVRPVSGRRPGLARHTA